MLRTRLYCSLVRLQDPARQNIEDSTNALNTCILLWVQLRTLEIPSLRRQRDLPETTCFTTHC